MHYMGVDIGSTASKVVIVDENNKIEGMDLCNLGAGTNGIDQAIQNIFHNIGVEWGDISYVVATGYGRQRFDQANDQFSEISCHAKGMTHIFPEVRTIVDIGGQDAKAIRLQETGVLDNFIMNEKCAAGTGRFLEVMARVLDCDISKLGELDLESTKAVDISSTCTVFAESEVISQLSAGRPIPDIVAGVHRSIAIRAAGLVRRLGPIIEPIAMSGGVARDFGVVRALQNELGISLKVDEQCQFCGALGAALYAAEAQMKD